MVVSAIRAFLGVKVHRWRQWRAKQGPLAAYFNPLTYMGPLSVP